MVTLVLLSLLAAPNSEVDTAACTLLRSFDAERAESATSPPLVETRRSEDKLLRGWAFARIQAPADLVFGVVTDHDAFGSFMPYVLASETRDVSDHTVVIFQRLDLPFPLSNREYEIELRQAQAWIDGSRCREESWSYVPDSGNVRANEGRWEVLSVDAHTSLVAYAAFVDPGGNVAAWMNNWATRQALPKVIAAVRLETARRLAAGLGNNR